MARSVRVIYLHGLAGNPGRSPALRALEADGIEVIAPTLPGFDGRSGWETPSDHLGWLTVVWDALDATGALPCPLIGASSGGMFAAELAALRPEAVSRLALLAPLGIWDDAHPGQDVYALSARRRLALLFAGDVPEIFDNSFAELDEAERGVARYVASIAGASVVWPIPDRGLADRVHRIRQETLLLWGERDRVIPIELAKRWPATRLVAIPDAGHLLEWDAPKLTAQALREFLRS